MVNHIPCSCNLSLIVFSPVGIDNPQDSLKFRILLAFFHNGQIITQGPQARLEFLVIQIATLVLVKVPGKKQKKRVSY